MQCSHCQHDNPQDAQFCNHCGQELAAGCSRCGHLNPDNARFCNQCGLDLNRGAAKKQATPDSYTPRHLAERILNSRSALEGERKRVTVLFVDVKGSTELAREAGDEAWHGILDEFFGILTHGVHRYEGNINQYTGDGIMALFGAPIAHEDHAQRACLAALEMQADLRRFADELRLKQGLNLSVRFGLNSGEVVVGRIGDDLRMDYTAKGQTVNLAARMEQIAEPGRIYLTRYTATQVEGYFRLRDLGEMPIKGIDEPVGVYELEGRGELKTRLDRSRARGLSQFVGRAREMQALQAALEEARQGRGQVAAVIGNAGIGKSRLCFEITERARSEGFELYQGTAVPYASAVPLHPVLGLLRSFFGVQETDPPAEQRRKIAGTLALTKLDCGDCMQMLFEYLGVSEGGVSSPVPPEMRQRELFDLLKEALLGGSQRPRIILIEDLHWLDEGSEQFISELAEALRETSTLLLLNYRPEYVSDWIVSQLDVEVSVTALSAIEVGEMVAALLGGDESLQELALTISQQAGGNPFFVEEAIRNLEELGYIQGSYGAYTQLKPVKGAVIPDTVQGILAARIDRLGDADKTLLEYAAVIGKEFGPEHLAAVMEKNPKELVEEMNNLEESGFIHQKELGGEYAFCHPLIQEVSYHSQLADKRSRIHARLAEHLEKELGGNTFDEATLMLAHHWTRSGNRLKAAEWQIHAANWEGVMRESDGALHRYRKAIELIDQEPAGEYRDKLAIIARSGLLRTSAVLVVPQEETRRTYDEALALAKSTGDELALAELNIAHASVELQQGDADVAVAQASEALTLARKIGKPELIERFRIPILLTYFASGRLKEGLEVLTEPGAEPWYSGPMSESNFLSRSFRALMLTYMGQPLVARQELKRAIEIEGESGRAVSWMHINLVDVARVTGHKEDALQEARAGVARSERFATPFFRELSYRGLAVAHGLNGNWKESARILEEHLPLVRPGGPAHQFEAIHLTNLAEAYLHLGELEKADDFVNQALDSSDRSHARVWACQSRLVHAAVSLQKGDRESAGRSLDKVEVLVEQTGAVTFSPFVIWHRACLETDPEKKQALNLEAIRAFEEMGATGWAEKLRTDLGQSADAEFQLG